MALNNYSADQLAVSVNGRNITDWGETDPPINHTPIDPASTLRRGQGGNACRLDRINPGQTVTINLNPGSPDSAFLQRLRNSQANITFNAQVVGSLEAAVGSEGVMVNTGPTGRGGQTITDDQYIIEFNTWTESKGGS